MPGSVESNTSLNTKSKTKDDRYHLFCFTHFDDFHNIFNLVGNWRYIVAGREICPDTKNSHFQCCVYFAQKISLSNLKKKLFNHLGKKPHVEVVYTDFETKYRYCTKDKDFYEWGVKPSQGARHDLNKLRDRIFNGEINCEEIRAEDPIMYHQYGRTLDKLEDDFNRKKYRTEMTTCEWIYGKTGVGKSHYAFKDYNPKTHYIFTDDNDWWDNYKGQDIVIINEFRGEIKFKKLLELIDKWPLCVRRRAREPTPFISKHIIITSCGAPDEIYHNALSKDDNIEQLYRRCEIKKFVKISDNF